MMPERDENPALEAIMAEIATTGRAQWIDACRRVQCSLAEISAARPRKPFEYYHFGLGRDLIEGIRKRPCEPSLCRPIVRGLCAYLRLATLDLARDGFCSRYGVLHLGRGISIENARILIRAELRRLAVWRAAQDSSVERRWPSAASHRIHSAALVEK